MGDAICIFQEDNERRINSTAILPGIMMLIFQIKGQRASGSYEKKSLCSPSTSHSPLHFNWQWKQTTCRCWEHWEEATVSSQPLFAFPACSGHDCALRPPNYTHTYSFGLCQTRSEQLHHDDACAQSRCPEAAS